MQWRYWKDFWEYKKYCYFLFYMLKNIGYVLIAQWIERLVAVQKVAGSIPAKDTNEHSS